MSPPPGLPSRRKQFLFVDDDDRFLGMIRELFGELSQGGWEIHLAQNHAQALEVMHRQKLDVVIVDIGMPVVDGIQFLRLLQRTHPGQQVVILTGIASDERRRECQNLGAQLFLEKPTAAGGYESIFSALDALAGTSATEGFRGMMRRVGLPEVLQMECLGAKSSILEVFTGRTRGRIYIQDGVITHAEKGNLEGEVALYSLLALRGGEFNLNTFEPPRNRTIQGQWEFLLMEAARLTDEGAFAAEDPPPDPEPFEAPTLLPAPSTPDTEYFAAGPIQEGTGEARMEEVVLCSGAGEVLYDWQCESLDRRLALLALVEDQGAQLSALAPFGRLDRLEIQAATERCICQVLPDRRLFVRGTGGPG